MKHRNVLEYVLQGVTLAILDTTRLVLGCLQICKHFDHLKCLMFPQWPHHPAICWTQ